MNEIECVYFTLIVSLQFNITTELWIVGKKTLVVSVVDQSKSRHGVVWLLICVCVMCRGGCRLDTLDS